MLEDYISKIEAYLDNELSEEEIEEFESFLQSNPSLQEELDAEIALRNLLDFDQDQRVLESFRILDKELDKKKRIIIRRNWIAGIAAVISLLIVSTIILQRFNQDPYGKTLASIQKHERVNLMSAKDKRSEFLDEVDKLYKAGKCGELKDLSDNSLNTDYVQLVLGMCYIEQKSYVSALKVFESEDLSNKRAFFQGLIYAYQADTLKACRAFQEVIKANGNLDHLKEAGELSRLLSCSDP